jgi:ribulose-5-phosphate 4-epimerase/fuculose-1-phosphate aldolase
VKAIVHSHSPSVIPYGVTGVPLRPLYHMSAFLADGAPVWDIRAAAGDTDMLVRTPALGRSLAQALGPGAVALMRGHGVVAVGDGLPQVVFRSVYTEVNARLQTQATTLGVPVTYLSPEEARRVNVTMTGTLNRPWELWKRKLGRTP